MTGCRAGLVAVFGCLAGWMAVVQASWLALFCLGDGLEAVCCVDSVAALRVFGWLVGGIAR